MRAVLFGAGGGGKRLFPDISRKYDVIAFVEAISSTSPMRGRKYKNVRPDLIILDDFQSEDDCRTEEAREKKFKKYSDDVKFAKQRPVKRNGKIIKKGTVLMAWGTQQHKECFYSRLLKLLTIIY